MNAIWTISGEPGKALDATMRSTAEVGMLDPILRLESLDVDTLTWTQRTGIIADRTQEIYLFRNGVCVFKGNVSSRPYRYQTRGGSGWRFVASGALYKMSIAQIQSPRNDVTQNGVLRPTYQFLSGDLREMVLRLLATSPGIVAGSVDSMFPVAQRTFTSGTFLTMLQDLLKPVVDAASWVNYAVAGTPQLNIVRRRGMPALIIEIGKDDVSEIDLDARTELQITGVRLAYSERNAAGQPIFKNQAAGDGSQLVIISGPEVGDFIPPDNNSQTDNNGGTAPTAPVSYTLIASNDFDAQFKKQDAGLKALGSLVPGSSQFAGTTIYDNFYGPGSSGFRNPIALNIPAMTQKRVSDDYSPSIFYPIVLSTTVPEWFKEQSGVEKYGTYVTAGSWVATWDSPYNNPSNFSAAFNALWIAAGPTRRGYGYARRESNNFDIRYWCYLPVAFTSEITSEATGKTLSQAGTGSTGGSSTTTTTTTSTTTTKDLGYGFIAPPEGMAGGMLDAASFIPYDGTISLNPGFPYGRFLATRCNVFGGDPELQAAGAIIQSMELKLQTGEVSLRAGAPARVTVESQLSNFNVNAKDNLRLL